MTGRELIIYILQNNLEDELVFEDGKFIGMMSIDDVASLYNVGPATVKAWLDIGLLKGCTVKEGVYILPTELMIRKEAD